MGDLGYAFNNIDFSDRVLRIEISGDWKKACVTWLKSLKRFSCNHPTVTPGYTSIVDHDSDDQRCSNSRVFKVRALNISSSILASESPYFHELFENETRESPKKEVTLRIRASEEAAVMDLLNYMHTNTLSATRAADLRSVLTVAIKFEVASCISHCKDLLQKFPKPPKPEVLICPKPSSKNIQPLKDAAKKCLVGRYRDFPKEEAMSLPLSALEVVLGSDGLQVLSEDDVFYFILKWADAHYPKRKEAREIVINRLLRFIHVPYLTRKTIQDPYVICWFEGCQENYSNMVPYPLLQAIHFNAGFGRRNRVAQDPQLTNEAPLPVKRVYIYHPVKVVNYFGPLTPRCAVYFFLTRRDVDNLFRSKRQCSMPFYLGDDDRQKGPNNLYLLAKCNKLKQETSLYHLGLYVLMEEGMPSCTLDYEFTVLMRKKKKKPLEEYKTVCKVDNCTLRKGVKDMDGKENLFGIPWTELMADDSEYFIDGILHLRAHLILQNNDNNNNNPKEA